MLVRAVTVSSTALELVLATALLIVLWRLLEQPGRRLLLLAGLLLGACLLAKSTLIYLAPLAVGVAVADWRRRRDTAGAVAAAALPRCCSCPG